MDCPLNSEMAADSNGAAAISLFSGKFFALSAFLSVRYGSGKPYGWGISTGNCGSFGVPMRSDTSTSHGSQPWFTSTSLCTDMYM